MKNIYTKIAAFCVFILSIAGIAASPAQAIDTSGIPSSTFTDSGYVNVNVNSAQEARLRANILSTAASQAGVPYVFNTASPGVSFDCSGFVSWVYYTNNIQMYRSVATMRPSVRTISESQVKPGDLVFSGRAANGAPTHVGIVVDPKAKTMWHAPAAGDVVRLGSYSGSWFAGSTFGTVITSSAPAASATSIPTIAATTVTAKTTASQPIASKPVAKAAPKPAAKVTTVKRYVKSGINLNVRASASASSKRVGSLKGGTAVTGVISNGWMKITSGTYSGRYISAAYLR